MIDAVGRTSPEVAVWRDSVLRGVQNGARFAGIYGAAEDVSCRVTALLAKDDGYDALDTLIAPSERGTLEYESLATDIKSAFWYERAMHDLSGVIPLGHPRPDALLLSLETGSERPRPGRQLPPEALSRQETTHGPVDVSGRGMFTLPLGPVRSGVFESIEFLIESPGEEIPHLNIRPHFKHRGVAKKFEGKTPADGVLVAERVEGIASVAHALAFSHAVERIADVAPPPRARLIRVVYAELERIANHLDVAMRLTDAAGLAVATARFSWHKETTMRLASDMCGSRFGRGVVVPGGVVGILRLSPAVVTTKVAALRTAINADAKLAMRTPSFLDRLRGTGELGEEYAQAWALVGPIARSSGGMDDLRWTRPTDAYSELPLPPKPAREESGDVMARIRVRWSEIDTAIDIILAALRRLEDESSEQLATPIDLSSGAAFGVGWSEGPQGEALHALSLKDGIVSRCFARSASFHNMVAFHDAFPTDVFTDFAFIEASFGLGYAGVAM